METAHCTYDWSLVREAQDGNHEAFKQLMQAHDEGVLRLALRMTGSLSDAQDIYQEVFLKAYKKLDCFRFECSFSTWIYRIATNTSLDHLRKHKQRKENDAAKVNFEGEDYDLLNQVSDDRPTCNPEKELLRGELGESILCALRLLTPREQIVFDMKHLQGMKLRAISEMLNTSEATVKTCLFRATHKLRLHLAKYATLQMELLS
ncbi:MAG: sigma-70 family RNA polymerase sigma factor [Terracidiphilus sp.]|jgi:RNA polymerase sigma-70 factor (ECF subfamily)